MRSMRTDKFHAIHNCLIRRMVPITVVLCVLMCIFRMAQWLGTEHVSQPRASVFSNVITLDVSGCQYICNSFTLKSYDLCWKLYNGESARVRSEFAQGFK